MSHAAYYIKMRGGMGGESCCLLLHKDEGGGMGGESCCLLLHKDEEGE